MKYFNQKTLSFLRELPQNNNREWFNANKETYKKEVETPFKTFISDLIIELQPYIPELFVEAKECVFRIYKDVRFSKDKTPYKNHVSAVVSKGGRKDKTTPGAYIQISGEDIRLYSGCFVLTPTQREQIRISIYKNLDSFNSIIYNPSFVKTFNEVRGEKYKKIPSPYIESAEIQPLLLNKSFYFYEKYKLELALSSKLLETIVNDYKQAIQINEFLREVLKK
ncbi:MAG TPA: DUF2461 domain-containing protein [Ignavibacteria bacterium]|nr:DUF2461 domain-containing protein [Ignavibacteria bacterium]